MSTDAPPRIDDLVRVLAELTAAVVRRGWTPTDLAEVTRRRLSVRHLPLVAALTGENAVGVTSLLGDPTAVNLARQVAALFRLLPQIADVNAPPRVGPGGQAGTAAGASSQMLAKVRALLAKAESTEFPAEAEALSAKAQELIATYALDRYAAQLAGEEPEAGMTVRRLWIDRPYVGAKATLIHSVADANHCRSVFSPQFGFVTLVGQAADVEATELLVTSLQVQADRAMLRHGRPDDRFGPSRTRSFRQSFLVSYASRIGERLRQAAEVTFATSSRSKDLVPVVARNDERVRAVTAELFPEVTTRRTASSNYAGWVAGRAAADLAQFDIRGGLTDQAAS